MIRSILDIDIYKLTMQAAVLQLYPDAVVSYDFINRRKSQKFNKAGYEAVVEAIQKMAYLQVTDQEIAFLQLTCPYLPIWYTAWLKNYRFDPSEIKVTWDEKTGEISISAEGLWYRTILWEVAILAIVSESYFKHVDTNWTLDGQPERIYEKGRILNDAGLIVSDFSTRRRRCFEIQDIVVKELIKFENFVGTSNPYIAMSYPRLATGKQHNPKGTMAHEWIMAHQHLGSIRHCNRDAMAAWQKVYKGKLGTALPDTLGSDLFFEDIDALMARSYDGLRHDSGPYQSFVERTIKFYNKHLIDPMTKSIIFSDGLDVAAALEIGKYCQGRIRCAFGIGTHFSNDFPGGMALNIVMKLRIINGVHVVKTSDVLGKAIGDNDALRVTRWVVSGTPLDAKI